jgi:hypothetical protein
VQLLVHCSWGSIVIGAFGAPFADRALVATPAWRELGPQAWATYSRHADLGNGLIVYPIYGIGLAVLAVAAGPIYLAALCAVAVLASIWALAVHPWNSPRLARADAKSPISQ